MSEIRPIIIPQEMKTKITQYVQLNSDVSETRKSLKKVTDKIKLLEEEITEYIKSIGVEGFSLPNGKTLQFEKKEQKKTLTKKENKEKIEEFFAASPEIPEQLFKFIEENTPSETKEKVKIK